MYGDTWKPSVSLFTLFLAPTVSLFLSGNLTLPTLRPVPNGPCMFCPLVFPALFPLCLPCLQVCLYRYLRPYYIPRHDLRSAEAGSFFSPVFNRWMNERWWLNSGTPVHNTAWVLPWSKDSQQSRPQTLSEHLLIVAPSPHCLTTLSWIRRRREPIVLKFHEQSL